MAKKKHIIRNSIKSFFESHTDPAKHEKLKASREDMEEKKKEMLSIVRSEEANDGSKEGPLAELIEDFHKQYESLYAHYDHLTGELKNKVHKHHHGKENSSSSSESDSDHSDKENNSKNGKFNDDHFRAIDNLQQELEASKVVIASLENKLEDICREKDTLDSAYESMMSKLEDAEKTVDDLKEENEVLNSEKASLLAEKEDLKSKVDDSDETEVDLRQQIAELIREKENFALEKEVGNQIVDDLKAEIEQLQGDKQSLEVQLGAHTTGVFEQMKALEEENSGLKLRLDIVMGEKRDIEEQFESEKTELRDQISQVETLLKEKHDRFSSLHEKLGVTEKESNSQIEALTNKLDVFTLEIDELRAEKSKLEEQVKELQEGIIGLEHELNTLKVRDREMESDLERKADDIAKYLIQIEELQQEYFHEKENLASKLKDFELMVEKLEIRNSALEDESRTKSDEMSRLKEEIHGLEKIVQNKEEEFVTLQRESGLEYSESLKMLEFQNTELKNDTEELKDALSHTREEYEQLEDDLRETKADLEAAQRRIEQLTMISESKDELAGAIEDLKRDKEAAEEDAVTAMEKTRTIEVRLRLANQKLRVTEQLLAEKEDDFGITEKRCREECKLLENKIAVNNQAYNGTIMNLSKNVDNFVAELESVNKKFEEENEKFSGRICKMSEELQILKHCIEGKNIEKEALEQQLRNLSETLQNETEVCLLMKQNLRKLEIEAENNKGENMKLQSRYDELKNTVMIVEEEKREAIRQLCLWSGDLQGRYDELKDIFAKSSLQRK